jgi:hypothetical protein
MAKSGPDEQEKIMKEQWDVPKDQDWYNQKEKEFREACRPPFIEEDSSDKEVPVWTLTIPWTFHNGNHDLIEKIQKVEAMSTFLWDLREGLRNVLKRGQHHSIHLYTDEKQTEQRPASDVIEDLQRWVLEELDDRRIRFDS